MSFKHLTPATLALAAALALAQSAAQAAPSVVLTAFEALGSATGPGTSVMDSNANGGDFYRSNDDGNGNSAFFHTYGTVGGLTYFGARASGTGTFFVNTSATYSDTYLNSSGSSQLVSFGFQVDSSDLTVYGQGTGYADLLLRLSFAVDGGAASVVAREHGRVTVGAGGTSCEVGDQDVGQLAGFLACSGGSASGSTNSYLVTQLLAPGQSLAVQYLIQSEAAGTLTQADAGQQCSYPPFGGDIAVFAALVEVDQPPVVGIEGEPNYSYCQTFNALARSGDPAGFNGFAPAQFNFSATTVPNAVPEPGSWALGALALAAALGARRRRA